MRCIYVKVGLNKPFHIIDPFYAWQNGVYLTLCGRVFARGMSPEGYATLCELSYKDFYRKNDKRCPNCDSAYDGLWDRYHDFKSGKWGSN